MGIQLTFLVIGEEEDRLTEGIERLARVIRALQEGQGQGDQATHTKAGEEKTESFW